MNFRKSDSQGIYLEKIEIIFPQTSEESIQVVLAGQLANPCLKIQEPEVALVDNVFTIELKTVQQGEMCIQVLEPFEKKIFLETEGLPAGVYTVDVLGQRKVFEWKNGN